MTGMETDAGEVSPSPGTRLIERDLAILVRGLEGLYRKRKYPLERAHYLLLLGLLGGPRSSGDLAASLALDHSTVTRQVAALERNGFVRKTPNPADGRSALITATDAGRGKCSEMQAVRYQRLEQMLSDWSEADRLKFAEFIARFNAAVMNTMNDSEGMPDRA